MLPDEKVIDALEKNGAALVALERFYQEKRAAEDRARAKIPAAADALLKRGMIDPHEAQELAVVLQDHEKCLELLKRAAQFVSAEEEGRLGQQLAMNGQTNGHQKKASEGLPPGGYIGRRTSQPSEAWTKFERDLGL